MGKKENQSNYLPIKNTIRIDWSVTMIGMWSHLIILTICSSELDV
jgi:hypothetical protein